MAEKEAWQQEAASLARLIAAEPSSDARDAAKKRADYTNRLAYLLNHWVVQECRKSRGDFEDYNWFFQDAFSETLNNYEQGKTKEFVPAFQRRFNKKRKGALASQLKEESPQETKASNAYIRQSLRQIASDAGMESKQITEELRKIRNMKNLKKVHAFLESLGYDESELEAFDKDVYDRRHTINLDAPPSGDEDESAAQNSAQAEAAIFAWKNTDDRIFEMLDPLLDVSYRKAQMDGKNAPKELRGFWTNGFIRLEMKDEDAEEREKHIFLIFFRENKELYNQQGKLDVRMAEKLHMGERTWREHRGKIHNKVFRIYNTLFHYRS